MSRLPSALGLGGAKRTGSLDWTLNPPMRSDSPNSPNPPSMAHPHRPPPSSSSPCTLGSYSYRLGGMDFVHYLSPFDRVGGKGRVNPKLLLGLEVLPPSLSKTFQPGSNLSFE
eukprot:scaffold7782_cov113-Isochrysis_galbana.AAC.3